MEEIKKRIKLLVGLDKLKEAAEELEIYFEGKKLSKESNDVTLCKRRLKGLEDNPMTITDESTSTEKSKIGHRLLTILDSYILDSHVLDNQKNVTLPAISLPAQPIVSTISEEVREPWYKSKYKNIGLLLLVIVTLFVINAAFPLQDPEKAELSIPTPNTSIIEEPEIELKESPNTTWRKEKDGYVFIHEGKRINNGTTAKDGNDLILFLKNRKETFRLENYFTINHNKLGKAKIETKLTVEKALWRADPDGYAFYFKGKRITDAEVIPEGDDLLVFMNKTEIFRLRDYSKIVDDKLRVADIETQ